LQDQAEATATRAAEPLRVAYLTSYFPPDFGGYGITLSTMLPHLVARGVVPTVVAFAGRGAVRADRSADASHVHRILSPRPGRLADLRRVFELRRFFKERRSSFDLLHTAVMGWELFLLMPYLRRLGLPVVIEMVLFGSDDALSIRREILGKTKLRSLRDAAAWIGLTEIFRASHLAAGLPPERFHALHNPVDAEIFHPLEPGARHALRDRLGIPRDAQVAITIGAVHRRKGMDRVLEAWSAMRPRPGRDLLLIVGPRTAAEGLIASALPFAEEMRRRAEQPDLRGTVRFLGRSDRIQDPLAAADLFLFLSRQEGFGTVVIEAMASGLPVVVSPLDGIGAEIVAEGRSGHVVPDPDDAAAVGALVGRILSDPAQGRRLGDAGRREAIERFSFARRTDRLWRIYAQVLRGRRPESPSGRGPEGGC
jgi:glycosyltransferase involved in cell wall biosynthesis